jgi:chromosome segregation protein
MAQCPDELAARLALVRAVEADEGQALAPGEWLVTRGGHLRRWDGFVARGEGAAQAAALEADNRLADLEQRRPALEQALAEADTAHEAARQGLSAVQAEWSGIEKAIGSAADAERSALRALDQAEAARATQAQRAQDLARARETLGQQRAEAEAEASAAQAQQAALPDPAQGRAAVEAAQGRLSDTARALQQASAAQAALEQALAVGRERLGGMKADQRNWQARADDATRSLAQMAKRAEELDAERAVGAAKPLGLMAQIEEGDAIGTRITADLAQAEAALAQAEQAGKAADAALAAANEALAAAREHRAGAIARAAHEDQRRQDMAGVSGDRFQCPPRSCPNASRLPRRKWAAPHRKTTPTKAFWPSASGSARSTSWPLPNWPTWKAATPRASPSRPNWPKRSTGCAARSATSTARGANACAPPSRRSTGISAACSRACSAGARRIWR